MIGWLLTYLLHSTLLAACACALERSPWGRSSRRRDAIWKCALAGALVTATLQAAVASLSAGFDVYLAPAAIVTAPVPEATPETTMWIVLAWGAVTIVAALRLGAGWLRMHRAAGRRRELTRGAFRRQLDAILREAGAPLRVRLTCSRGVGVPRAIGRREICVPVRALRDLTADEQHALLAHEVAHLVRRDAAWLMLAAVLQTLAWWQPLTRLAVARLRQSMELCCDDWAAARVPDRTALAACLVKIAEWGVSIPCGVPLAAMAAPRSSLRERVERLTDSDHVAADPPRVWPWPAAFPLLLVMCVAPSVKGPETSSVRVPAAVVVSRPVAEPPVDLAPVAPAHAGLAVSVVAAPKRAQPATTVESVVNVSAPVAPPRAAPAAPSYSASSSSTAPEPSVAAMTDAGPATKTTLRDAIAAAQFAAPAVSPARRKPLVPGSAIERRIGVWLDWQGRALTFDPNRPKYAIR